MAEVPALVYQRPQAGIRRSERWRTSGHGGNPACPSFGHIAQTAGEQRPLAPDQGRAISPGVGRKWGGRRASVQVMPQYR